MRTRTGRQTETIAQHFAETRGSYVSPRFTPPKGEHRATSNTEKSSSAPAANVAFAKAELLHLDLSQPSTADLLPASAGSCRDDRGTVPNGIRVILRRGGPPDMLPGNAPKGSPAARVRRDVMLRWRRPVLCLAS